MWILLDNYDSFTHILHHYLLLTGHECDVYRNDQLTLTQLINLKPERLILSPGPRTPTEAGITMDAIAHFYNSIPILGVCLGHQALGMYFGAQLVRAPYPMHGKVSSILHNEAGIFNRIPSPTQVMRYHSLAITLSGNEALTATAHTDDGTIMALQHNTYPCVGVQFHPESVGTVAGQQMLDNWARLYH